MWLPVARISQNQVWKNRGSSSLQSWTKLLKISNLSKIYYLRIDFQFFPKCWNWKILKLKYVAIPSGRSGCEDSSEVLKDATIWRWWSLFTTDADIASFLEGDGVVFTLTLPSVKVDLYCLLLLLLLFWLLLFGGLFCSDVCGCSKVTVGVSISSLSL